MEKATALVTLVNSADRIRHAHGYRETNVVRSMSVSVVVSPSIALPVITESIAWRLGLTEDGTVAIRMGEKRITVAMV